MACLAWVTGRVADGNPELSVLSLLHRNPRPSVQAKERSRWEPRSAQAARLAASDSPSWPRLLLLCIILMDA